MFGCITVAFGSLVTGFLVCCWVFVGLVRVFDCVLRFDLGFVSCVYGFGVAGFDSLCVGLGLVVCCFGLAV